MDPSTKLTASDLTKEQLLEKIAILQSKFKEVLAKKNTLVSALTIEKLHNKQYEEANHQLIQENSHLTGLLGVKTLEIPEKPQNSDIKPLEKSEFSSESYEFLDIEKLPFMNSSISSQINREISFKKPEFDIKLKLNSLKDLELGSCSIKTSQGFLENDRKPMILCAFGDKNTGKTHILNKICGFDLQIDTKERTKSQGIILKYSKDHEFAYIDLYGNHLSYEDLHICYKSLSVEERIIYKGFSEDFMLDSCDAILVLLGEKSFEDEVLMEKIKKLQFSKKKIFIIHNFLHLNDVETVEKRIKIDMKSEGKTQKNLNHVVFAKEWTIAAEKYNKKGVEILRKELLSNQEVKSFDFITKFKEFYCRNCEKYLLAKGSFLEETTIKEKRVLLSRTEKNQYFCHKLMRFDAFGNIIENSVSPLYTVVNISSNFMKVFIEMPGVLNYKVELSKNLDGYDDSLILLLNGERMGIGDFEEERKLEGFETKIKVKVNEHLICQRCEIKGGKMVDGVLEVDLELF